MQEFDESKPIRDLFGTYESLAPDFDSLFEGEVLGDAPLRQICQAKFDHFEPESPAFEELFPILVQRPFAPRKRLVPLWISIGAAACFALFMLLPHKIQMDQGNLSLTEMKKEFRSVVKKKSHLTNSRQETLSSETVEPLAMLHTPKSIKPLVIVRRDNEAKKALLSYEEALTENASSENQKLTKIVPSNKMAVKYERSVEEAYAEAKALKKSNTKHDKLVLGTHFNSANRLLSLVNTKSANIYPLQAVASKYSLGYSSLEGASTSLLRAAVTSKNAWEAPDNIPGEILKNYDAVYDLPLNFGLSVAIPLSNNLEIVTGLNYTYMSGEISGETNTYNFNLKQELHYIGVPVKIALNIFRQGHFGAYAAVGGTIEKGIAGIQHSKVVSTSGEKNNWDSSQPVYGLQPSLTGQLGLEYQLNKTFNIYLEPGVSYYIPNDQPISSRTEEPFNFNLSLGLRYRIH